jgi:proteasome accessory factor A
MGWTVTETDLKDLTYAPARICGLETEYAVSYQPEKKGATAPHNDTIFEALWASADDGRYTWPTPGLQFLRNGARFHPDFGHAEWATPECRGPLQAVLYDVAGERVVESLLPGANDYLRSKKFSGQLKVFKNNVDAQNNTYGCHENYQVARATPGLSDPDDLFRYLVKSLVPFLVTRQILCGAGHVAPRQNTRDKSWRFHISQRAAFIDQVVSVEATSRRAIINSRDEPHGDIGNVRRLHLILGDANLSPWSAFLKMGMTALVLRMIEDTSWIEDLTLENPVMALKQISADPECRIPVRLRDGTRVTALEIQQRYCNAAGRYLEQYGGTAEEGRLLELWRECLTDLEPGSPGSSLRRRLDWSIKLEFIRCQMAQHRLGWDSPLVKEMDIKYHDIDRRYGIYYLLLKNKWAEPLLESAAIEKARRQPPCTRATLRTRLIQAAHRLDWFSSADWEEVEVGHENDKSLIVMPDPLAWEVSTVEPIFDQKPSLNPLRAALLDDC